MIRPATALDKPALLRMLGDYRMASPLEFHKTTSLEHAGKILDAILGGAGVAWVAEDTKGVYGMLMVIKNPNIWNPEIMALHEIAYWVDPDMRGGSAGYKLLLHYTQYAEQLKKSGTITYYTVSKMVTSPDLNYERFGFTKLEEMWRA